MSSPPKKRRHTSPTTARSQPEPTHNTPAKAPFYNKVIHRKHLTDTATFDIIIIDII